MIKQSNHRQGLITALSALIPAAQTETHAVDEAASIRLRINQTDLRCLGTILDLGPLSASKLAESVRLTRAAMTTALDRLEKAGFIRRLHDLHDRRGINVEATPAAQKAVREIWEPIRIDGLVFLEKYSDEDLELLSQFFEEYCALQRDHTQRIRRLK
ncbi:MAG: MarR family transcriptional regulator [Desulfobaccales bacterium]